MKGRGERSALKDEDRSRRCPVVLACDGILVAPPRMHVHECASGQIRRRADSCSLRKSSKLQGPSAASSTSRTQRRKGVEAW